MKLLLSFLLYLFSPLASLAQKQQLYNLIFTDSIIATMLRPLGHASHSRYILLSRTDMWQLRRFYFQPSAANQHPEGMNPFAYNDTLLQLLITRDEWNMLARRALVQKPAKIKHPSNNLTLVDSAYAPKGKVFFSITNPVFYHNWALIDLSYYQPEEAYTSPAQSYKGQALFVFMKQSKHTWALVKMVNSYVR